MFIETLGVQHLGLFVASGLLLNLTPGQDTLYILGRTLSQGRSAGLMSALGISAGGLVHTLLAAFGLSAILATSPTAFLLVKYAGAAYLTWLGVRLIVDARAGSGKIAAFRQERSWVIFQSGLLTNVLNPKVALFFLAFLPQFIAPAAESRIVALLFLGLVFVVNGLAWCCVLVWGASVLGARFRAQPSAETWLKRVTGIVFLGLGVRLAVSR